MAAGNTFVAEKVCPVCGKTTRVTRVRSRLMAMTTDCDFCTHYKNFNPYYYTVWVCEHCAYAADEKRFTSPMPSRHQAAIQAIQKKHRISFEYHEERNLPEAVAAYRLAIFYDEQIKGSLGHLAGLYLELAWVYRLSGDIDNEEPMLRRAATLYEQSLMTERYPVGALSDTMAMYLTGAIYYRLHAFDQATNFLGRLISDQSLRGTNPKIYDRARDLWQDIRLEKEAEEKRIAAEMRQAAAAAGKRPFV